jgi:CDGSH-type Zn-finger protein
MEQIIDLELHFNNVNVFHYVFFSVPTMEVPADGNNIYHDCRYTRSKSCPFCRGSLKRVRSRDLWVLTRDEDVIDTVALEKENVRHFHSFIDSLPLIVPDNLLLVYYDYLV